MFGKLLKLNLKELQLAFFAGSAVGATVGTIAGAGIGMGVGALLGILFAPKSGVETRESLKESINEAVEAAKGQTEMIMDKAEMLKGKAVDACSSLHETISEKINSITEAA